MPSIAKYRIIQWIASMAMLGAALLSTQMVAAPLTPAIPPNVLAKVPKPMILLNMSRDHQLSYRAYDEYSDLNNDGTVDKTYLHAFDYYGYFDPYKCYTHNGNAFVPQANSANKYCSGLWSGNFLNWASMTKMDVMRKVLYGGFRSTDKKGNTTVLERAYLPTDAHSFAKYYNGTDIGKLTPFGVAEISLCNATLGATSGANQYSHSNTNPPLLRVAKGNFELWNANERWQCYWKEEKDAYNGNNTAITGSSASGFNPVKATVGLGSKDYIVRVEVCKAGLLGTEKCNAYPSGDLRPTGLLHQYGENDQAEFALITGSFDNNIKGGVLRSNMASFRNEINVNDGTFVSGYPGIVTTVNKLRIYGYDYGDGTYIAKDNCTYQITGLINGDCSSWGNPMGEMFMEGLRYLAGKNPTAAFNVSRGKDAALGLPAPAWVDPFNRGASINNAFGIGQCRPINAVHINASVISYDSDDWASSTDLPNATWFSSEINAIGTGEGIDGTLRFVGETATDHNKVCTAKTVGSLNDVQGICPDGPAYKGSYSLAGMAYWARTNRIRNETVSTASKNAHTAYKVHSFAVSLSTGKPSISIPNPEKGKPPIVIQPTYRLHKGGNDTVNNTGKKGAGGGALVDFRVISQLHDKINKNAIEGKYLIVWEDSEQGGDYDQDVSGILEYKVDTDNKTVNVSTSVFADATFNPQGFGYTITGTSGGKDGTHFHSGVDGFEYTDPTNVVVKTITGAAHPNINASGGCKNCNVNDPPSHVTYAFGGGSAISPMPDPMWLAAKWGGFKDPDANTAGTTPYSKGSKWDEKINDTGAPGKDDIPDNYFLAVRPSELEKSLSDAFSNVVANSNNLPTVSSGLINANSLLFNTIFDPNDGHGELSAYAFDAVNGVFSTVPTWSAHTKIAPLFKTRPIITNDGNLTSTDQTKGGKAFTYAALNGSAAATAIYGTATSSTLGQQALINWFRGDRSNDGLTPSGLSISLRQRNSGSVMGSVISSTPAVVGKPNGKWFGKAFSGYGDFIKANRNRASTVWVGAGDGMLHAFNASADLTNGGKPVLSYVPGMLHNRLQDWANKIMPPLQSFVDSSPMISDVMTATASTSWKTYLFNALGRGGKGVFALDITNPSALTETNASNIFKWQFGEADDSSGDLGYMLAQGGAVHKQSGAPAMVAKMNNGEFALIMPNGYQSKNGSAALYILFVKGPNPADGSWAGRYVKLVADAGSTSAGGSTNGLSHPTWVDMDNDGLADYIYAGDLNGNLWKFDVKDKLTSNWKVAFGGKALFKATDATGKALPMTSAPGYKYHPAGGLVVTVGTGKAIDSTDFPDSTGRKDHVFGIWDQPLFRTNATALPLRAYGSTTTWARRTLDRSISNDTHHGLTGDAINWTTHAGWSLPLPEAQEANIANPLNFLGLLAYVSITPTSETIDCTMKPNAYVTLIDPLSGLLPASVGLRVNQSTSYSASFQIETQNPGVFANTTGNASSKSADNACANGAKDCATLLTGNGTSTGKGSSTRVDTSNIKQRSAWQELFGFRTRPATSR